MATYNWTALVDGQVILFNPAADLLAFDDAGISASNVLIELGPVSETLITYNGKTVSLQAALSSLTTADFTFTNTSVLLLGTGGSDSLAGAGGDDQLVGGNGDDTLNGGAGSHDAASYANAIFGVTVNLALAGAQATGGAGSDTLVSIEDLRGSQWEDALTGNAGYNILHGMAGDDTLDGGAFFDDLYGGAGNDTFIVDQSDDFVFESPDEGRDIVLSSASFLLDDGRAIGVEDLTLTGMADSNAGGNSLDNVITGNAGNNQLSGGAGSDVVAGGGGNDTLIGEFSQPFTIERASADSSEVQGNNSSGGAAISAHGRYVAFESFATNLVAGDTNARADIFVRDRTAGTLERVSTDAAGVQANGNSANASLSADGLLVAFQSDATNFVAGDTALIDIFVKDVASGAVTRASSSSGGLGGNLASTDPALSADGRFVAFESSAFNLVALDNNGRDDIFVKNLADGTLLRASTDIGGVQGDDHSRNAAIAADGQFVAFDSLATNLVAGDSNAVADVFVKNLGTGEVTRASTGTGGTQGNGSSSNASISADGRFVAFHSSASNLVAGDTNGVADVFVKDLLTGTLTRASISLAGAQANGESTHASISADGRFVAFQSVASNLVANDFGAYDIFVKDLATGVVTRLSTDAGGAGGNNNSILAAISADARFVAFESLATNLVTPDSGATDVFAASTRAADLLWGGEGDDTYSISSALDVVSEDAAAGTDTVFAAISYTLTENVENLTLSEIAAALNGTGNALGNSISGNSFGNLLDGGAGADTLVGGAGDDTYVVDDALDEVTEGVSAGADTVLAGLDYTLGANLENLTLGGTGDFEATGNGVNNVLTGNSGDNRLDGAAGADTMAGGLGDDIYIVDDAGDSVFEAPGAGANDTMESSVSIVLAPEVEELFLFGGDLDGTGNNLANVIVGTAGSNVLDGAAGSDMLVGGAGDDTYRVDSFFDQVIEEADEGHDAVEASVGYSLSFGAPGVENLVLTGTDGLTGTGNALDNHITGNSGADSLDGRAGADTMAGGLGSDSYTVDDAGDVVLESPGEGHDTVHAFISYVLLPDFESLTLQGFDDIDATGNALGNLIIGNFGANVLTGGGGSDTMIGGEGNDTYVADADDVLDEFTGSGTDTVLALAQIGALEFGLENLVLVGAGIVNGIGNFLDNDITGNAIGNLLDGGAGADTLHGGDGDDSYVVGEAGDLVIETAGQGTDTVTATVSFTLSDHVENLVLGGTGAIDGTGNALDNVIYANNGDNLIDGGGGNDTAAFDNGSFGVIVQLNLSGMPNAVGAGGIDTLTGIENVSGSPFEDTLVGDAGANVFDGNGGADTVVYAFVADGGVTVDLAAGTAVVTGEAADTLLDIENLVGSLFDDTLRGSAADNLLDGGEDGADLLEGREGDDTYIVDDAGDVVVEEGSTGGDAVKSYISWTLGANLESLWLLDTGAIDGTGNALDNAIHANVSDNVIDGAGGADLVSYESGAIAGVTVDLGVAGAQDTGGSGFDTLLNVENLRGTGFADRLTGNALGNLLDGGTGGADTLVGGAGADTYVVEAGDVVIESSTNPAEIDTVRAYVSYTLGANLENLVFLTSGFVNATGNILDNFITATMSDNVIDGGKGNDTVSYADAVATSGSGVTARLNVLFAQDTGGSGLDTLRSIENLVGSAFADDLAGNAAANWLEGGEGNDTLNGGAGADTMLGGAGDDDYVVNMATDVVTEGAGGGTDTVRSNVSLALGANLELLALLGTADINATGNSLANGLTGNGGANVLNGGAGADTMAGGAGSDTYVVDNAGDVVTEGSGAANGTADEVQSSIAYTLGANLERLLLTGGGANNGTGNGLANVITGNGAANRLIGGGGNDTLLGGGGADTLTGSTGADSMAGGAGSDAYNVDDAGDVVTELESEGNADQVNSSVDFTLGANVERLFLTTGAVSGTGNGLDNMLSGNDAGNTLDGGAGEDTLIGGLGDDTYIQDHANDVTTEGLDAGTDTVQSSVTAALRNNVEHLTLTGTEAINGTGNALDNALTGNDGANALRGSEGDDTLIGGIGDDSLRGGLDKDLLTGGEGNDSFFFEDAPGAANADQVTDFAGGTDNLRLNDSAFTEIGALGAFALNDARFLSGAGLTAAQDADDRIVYDTTSGNLYYDADGLGGDASLVFATLQGAPALAANDIVVI